MTLRRSFVPKDSNRLALHKHIRKSWARKLGVDVAVLAWNNGRLYDLRDGRILVEGADANLHAPPPALIPHDPREDFVPFRSKIRGPEPSQIPQSQLARKRRRRTIPTF